MTEGNSPTQGRGETVPYNAAKTPPESPRIMFTGCNTSQSGCAGVANFTNTYNGWVSFAVFLQNGSAGRSNFVLAQGQSHQIHVQTGDTWASAYGDSGVPDGTQRNWINVG